MADLHMWTIANNIYTIDADIYIMPEVQDCCVVDYWYETYFTSEMKDLYNYYLVRGIDYYTGQNILLLTKIDPIDDILRTSRSATYPRNDSTCSGTWGDDYQSMSKNLLANFTFDNFPSFTLIGVHFLARPTDSSRCGTREAQATVVQSIVRDYYNSNQDWTNFVILGDFNDYDSKYPDRHGHTPITNVLYYLKHIMIDKGEDLQINLTNTAQYINQTWRYTHWPQSDWEEEDGCLSFASSYTDQYDYVLLTKELNDMIDNVTIGWELCGTYESDHLPVIVDLVNQTARDILNSGMSSTSTNPMPSDPTSDSDDGMVIRGMIFSILGVSGCGAFM